MCLTPLTLLVALAISHGLAAQDSAMQNQKAKHHMYRLVDVGTLGGPLSQFASSTPLTVNSGGIGTAIADTSIPDPLLTKLSGTRLYGGPGGPSGTTEH
jgi:hypothetical protein